MGLELVEHDSVIALIGMTDAISAVRTAFIDFEHDLFEMPTRLGLGEGSFLFMPVRHRPTESAVIKTLSLNFSRVPPIAGTVTWVGLSHATSLVIEAEAVTQLRTGAAVGVATDLMAPPGANRLTMIGAGAQALYQVLAVDAVRPLTQVRVVDLDGARAHRLVEELGRALPQAQAVAEPDARRAVADAQIVNCATTSRSALFQLGDLAPSVHVNAIGAFMPGMRELPDELLAQATVVVDDPVSCLAEAGEIIESVAAGVISPDHLLPIGRELLRPFERTPLTVFKSVGIAPQDWAVARLVAERVAERTNRLDGAAVPTAG